MSFLAPSLRTDMSLLDASCGPGSITLELVEMIGQGHVTGIDMAQDDIERALELAAQQGVKNIEFQVASVYEIPYPDNTYDAVFLHGMLEHLSEPVKALKELRQVLPGGVLGAATPHFSGLLVTPTDHISSGRWICGFGSSVTRAETFSLENALDGYCAKQDTRISRAHHPRSFSPS